MDFLGSDWMTFGCGCQAFAKKEGRMEIPFLLPTPPSSWPLPATPSAARHRRLIYQVRHSPQVLPRTGSHDRSGHLTRSLPEEIKRVGGNAICTGSIRNRLELFCIGAKLVRKCLWRRLRPFARRAAAIGAGMFEFLWGVHFKIRLSRYENVW